jgi:hypothetical protein
MKEVTRSAAQGDAMFRKVQGVPQGFIKRPRKGDLVVSHSESGHHHVIRNQGVNQYEFENQADPAKSLICYLVMGDDAYMDVEHLRDYDTHETLRLRGNPGDVWEVRRQREHTPEGWRRVMD